MKAIWQNAAAWILLSSVAIVSHSFAGYHFTTLDDPLASGSNGGTSPYSIYQGSIVGVYTDSLDVGHGFLLSGTTYTTLDDPLANGYTSATGVSGSNIVGFYSGVGTGTHGFLLTGTTYTPLADPLASSSNGGTIPEGLSGSDIVGNYFDSDNFSHGFLLSGATYTTLDDPLASDLNGGTSLEAISGSSIVGTYDDSNGVNHGFLLSGTTYTTIDDPLASDTAGNGTLPFGIFGNDIVGSYNDRAGHSHGFIYNGSKYTTVDDPLATGSNGGTTAFGIYQGNIVGTYYDKNAFQHGFLATPAGPDNTSYTLLLTATDSAAGIPPATGYATMTVSHSGGVMMSGHLPDGEPFSTYGSVAHGFPVSTFSIDRSLSYPSVTNKGSAGFLFGSLSFIPVSGTSDLSGTLEWIKPQQTKGLYQAPFDTNLVVIGSLYTPPTNEGGVLPGFPVEGAATGGVLALSDTSGLILSATTYLTTSNKLTITNPPDKLKVSITPSTGVFKGSFEYPGPMKKIDFTGVLFQDQTIGEGLFLGPDGSGTVTLTP